MMKITTLIIKIFNKILKFFPLNIMSSNKSVEYLLSTSDSLSRYGDGELCLILGGNIHFQDYNSVLAERLKNILSIGREEDFIVGIPIAINSTKKYNEYTKKFWSANMSTGRMHWYRFCRRTVTYVNASFTWCYMDYKDKEEAIKVFKKIFKIWEGKKILLIEGCSSKVGVNNSLLTNATMIKRILCPSRNAFEKYDKILKCAINKSNGFDMIMISLGPTATILAYDLHKKGLRAIDIGHLNKEYEDYLKDCSISENEIISVSKYRESIIETIS